MNAVSDRGAVFRDWYTRNALGVIFFILALTLASLIIGVIGTFVNAAQNADRAADNKRRDEQAAAVSAAQQELLDCFDAYANASSSSSKAVRVASIAKDEATAVRDDALNAEGVAFSNLTHAIRQSLEGAQVDREESRRLFIALDDALDARAKAGRQLDRAQAALDKARAENPVPDPPSKFCGSAD